MDSQEMFYSINKGVPNYLTVPINIDTLVKECASDSELFYEEMKQVRNWFTSGVVDIMGYAKSQHGFFGYLATRCTYKNSRNDMYVSPDKFLWKLKEILGVKNPSMDFNDLDLRQQLRDRVAVLRDIKTPEELENEFPLIYEDYKLSIRGYGELCRIDDEVEATGDMDLREMSRKKWKTFKSYGLHSKFDYFIAKQVTAYRNYVERRTFIEGMCYRNPLDLNNFKGLDKDKFELYLADKYLSIAFSTNNMDIKQKCVYYVATYIREVKISDLSIKNDEGVEVTFRKLVNRYKKLLRENQVLKPIDERRSRFEGYNIKHVANHLIKYYGSSVSWTIVPNGEEDDDELKQKIAENLNSHYRHLPLEERRKRILEKYNMYERKVSFFEGTGYILKIYGMSQFDGYVAFVYPNGEILLERFFSDYSQCMPATGEAIYNLNIYNFEELSKFSKLQLIRDKACKRILHGETFEKQAQAIIDRPIKDGVQDDVEAFVLKFKPKKTVN